MVIATSALIFSCKKDNGDACMGTPTIGCTCPQASNPVCGCNNVNYNNGCEATCAGVKSYTFGICP